MVRWIVWKAVHKKWIETYYIIYDYCTVLLPHEAGDLLVGAFSGLFFHLSFSGTPGSDIASPQTRRKGTSNIQHPTKTNNQHSLPFLISDTRHLVFINVFSLLYGGTYHPWIIIYSTFSRLCLCLTYSYVFFYIW